MSVTPEWIAYEHSVLAEAMGSLTRDERAKVEAARALVNEGDEVGGRNALQWFLADAITARRRAGSLPEPPPYGQRRTDDTPGATQVSPYPAEGEVAATSLKVGGPDAVTVTVCDSCTRTDRWAKLTERHYARSGGWCPGPVHEVTYIRA